MILNQHYLGCLSQASYLIGDEETGTAAVVDPRRDVDLYVEEAGQRGLTIRHVLLTHLHADFASGHLELREKVGAEIHFGSAARTDFPFTPLADGQSIRFGTVRIQALETPGHTPESTCYLVFDLAADEEKPHAILTGDTLFIGDVGRPDLLASQGMTAEELAGHLYDSLREKILPLPDETIVYPGHGAGSACGKNLSSETSSTLGQQRQFNYALQPISREEFVRIVTAGQPAAPAYFSHDARFNREEHPLLDEAVKRSMRPLTLDRVLHMGREGAVILDVRSAGDYGRGHLRGSVNIGLDGKFASWAGTLLDLEKPIVLLAEPGKEREAIVRLGRIGLDRVAGYLEGGAPVIREREDLIGTWNHWSPSGLDAALNDGAAPLVLDIRGAAEMEAGFIQGSLQIPLEDLAGRAGEVPRDREVVAVCATGYRSAIAASLLRRAGVESACNLDGGLIAWSKAGLPMVKPRPPR